MAGEGRLLKNAWKAPEDVFGPSEKSLKSQIQAQTMRYDFSSEEWNQACAVVDDVLDIILVELQNQSQRSFEGLTIDKRFIRQAGARQGLKIEIPDEFDAVVPFKLPGLQIQEVRLKNNNGQLIPGQMRLRIINSDDLKIIVPRLNRLGAFQMDQGTCFINTRVLQEQVFKSLMDKTLFASHDTLMRKGYSVTRGSRPPTMNITISSRLPFHIDVDFVPGLDLGREAVMIPESVTTHPGSIRIDFPRFGLMKWVNKENPHISERDKDFIWRNCSSSYERYMFDMCLGNRERLYIVTSCRVMKALVKVLRKRQNHAANLLTSYHLKTVAMYCILLLTVPTVAPPDLHISGVREALGYFLKFLKLVFKKEILPEFFLGNEYLDRIFPDSYFANEHRKYNLFQKENPQQVEAAKYCFGEMEQTLTGCYSYENVRETVVNRFENRVLRM
ncbi:uncharacterized protein LOC133181433 [Saccostrea echinata]|uniref:uncharacterized protein LOC133181433 n=1 Tax=Saccostrea echinata TaxID=191078 RepID=UPI002A80B041|nr:uncharacterized protein LOC133181433 [Saccostrea echinata]